MLTNKHLKGFAIRATDGELGTVEQLYFDDEIWAIRYLVVDTGGWLGGRRVLISPMSVTRIDWDNARLDVALTKAQVEHSPGHRHAQARFLSARGRVPRVLRVSLLLGWPISVGLRRLTLRVGPHHQPLQRKQWQRGSGGNRMIRICAVPKPLLAITLRRLMVKSAT